MAQTCGDYGRHRQQEPDDAGRTSCPCGTVRRFPPGTHTPDQPPLPARSGTVTE